MKISHVTPIISQTGLWRHLEAADNLIDEFVHQCIEIFNIKTSPPPGPLKMECKNLGFPVEMLHEIDQISDAICTQLGEFKPDIIHTYHLFSDPYAARAAGKLGVPAIRTVAGVAQGSWIDPFARVSPRVAWNEEDNRRQKQIEHLVHKTIAVSNATRNMLIEAGFSEDKVVVSYLGTSTSVEPKCNLRDFSTRRDSLVVGFPHRIEPSKLGPALLPGLRSVVSAGLKMRFILVRSGEGFERFVSNLTELGVETTILEPGPNLWDRMPSLDCLLLASVTEGLPLLMLEAMVRQVPVIASKVGGVGEVLFDGPPDWNGYTFDFDDPYGLADALTEVATYPSVAKAVAKRGETTVRRHFDRTTHEDELSEIYRSLVGRDQAQVMR